MTTQVATSRHAGLAAPRIAAGIIWSASVWTTANAIAHLGVSGYWLMAGGIVVQVMLTALESQIWSGRGSLIEWLALVVDILINMGGLWPWIQNIDQTPTWDMLIQAMGAPSDLGNFSKLAVCILPAVFLAYAPERMWRRG